MNSNDNNVGSVVCNDKEIKMNKNVVISKETIDVKEYVKFNFKVDMNDGEKVLGKKIGVEVKFVIIDRRVSRFGYSGCILDIVSGYKKVYGNEREILYLEVVVNK